MTAPINSHTKSYLKMETNVNILYKEENPVNSINRNSANVFRGRSCASWSIVLYRWGWATCRPERSRRECKWTHCSALASKSKNPLATDFGYPTVQINEVIILED